MTTPIQTQRLILREMTHADYPALAAILQDEQTMYAYEGAFDETETRAWLDNQLSRYRSGGFGLWAAVRRDSGEMIGQAGITWQNVRDERVPEIGYLFNRAHWGQGYATEAASICKAYAFTELGFYEIYSIIRDTNLPSMNVAIRNGMLARDRIIKHYRGVDMPHLVFSARKPASGPAR